MTSVTIIQEGVKQDGPNTFGWSLEPAHIAISDYLPTPDREIVNLAAQGIVPNVADVLELAKLTDRQRGWVFDYLAKATVDNDSIVEWFGAVAESRLQVLS